MNAAPSYSAAPLLVLIGVAERIAPAFADWARFNRLPLLVCHNVAQAVQRLPGNSVGLIVLGETPEARRADVLRALRSMDLRAPVMWLVESAARFGPASRAQGRADHLLITPCSRSDVLATLDSVWHAPRETPDLHLLIAEPVHVDEMELGVTVDGYPVPLPHKQLRILVHLMKNSHRIVPIAELALTVIGTLSGDPRRIPKDVHAVRRALQRAAPMIETHPGGYRFNPSAVLKPRASRSSRASRVRLRVARAAHQRSKK